MAFKLPDGAIVSIASVYGAALAVSALTNAASAVATLPANHGLEQADLVVISSGWLKVEQRVARLASTTS